MTDGVKNWEEGARRGRVAQTMRSQQRAEAVREAIEFIAWKYRPTTRAEYARILVAEGCPTPSGRGKWTGNLVNQYMRKFGQTAKSLLAQFPERSGIGFGYRPEVYAALRSEMMRVHAPNGSNGTWRPALEVEPTHGQPIFHKRFGHGCFVERTGPAKLLCRFENSAEANDRECPPAGISVFVFHLSMEARQAALITYWERLIAKEKQSHRKLVDGWHL